MSNGPQPLSSEQRRQNVQEIARALHEHYRDQLLALGVYGSVARQLDGPFSDIEMHCVLHGEGIDQSFEWSTGPWKAEVDVYSPDVILAQAAELDGEWSITHGAFVYVWPLFDPQEFFPRMEETVYSHSEEKFRSCMKDVIVGEIYELVGKVRNAWVAKAFSSLPAYTNQLARYAAGLVGLSHRFLFPGSATLYEEALRLPDAPLGFANLCEMVTSGRLTNKTRILSSVNSLWDGIELWAKDKNLNLTDDLKDLLRHDLITSP